ncbi:unnamed protein product [Ambrosiozyma monospora]|uniref:Unnamed protein product n=1 Tax=Ambrosiozyma monospora TaxID=43982 RepID=A0ACB5T2D4_AMBMO|nr:unnamed protein product [Ambrosiozyma monospora]
MSDTLETISVGSIIFIAIKPIIKVYMIIGVGFFLARKNVLSIDTTRDISYIVVTVLVPCLNFAKIVTNIDNSFLPQIGTIMITLVMIMIGQGLLTFGVGLLAGCPRSWWGGLFMCGLLPNISDLPIAYLQGMQSSNVFADIDLGVSYICIYGAVHGFVQFNLGAFRIVGIDFDYDKRKKIDEETGEVSESNSQKPEKIEVHTDADDADKISIQSYDEANNYVQPIYGSDEVISHRIPSLMSSLNSRVSHPLGTELVKNPTAVDSMYHNPTRSNHPESINDLVKVYSKYNNQSGTTEDEVNDPDESDTDKRQPPKSKAREQFDIFLSTFIENTLKPASISTVVSVIICMVPWLKALFVNTHQAHLSPAPDKQPPLSFFIDFTSYIGNAQVPFGLMLLGGTIGRIRLEALPKGLWKMPLVVTIVKLILFPVIGCALNSKLQKDDLFYGDKILYFVSTIEYCLPPATSIIYFTAFYTPTDGEQTIQMDILALVYIFHYVSLIIFLPIVVTYTMKVLLGF